MAASGVAACVLAFIYAYAVYFIPFIYLNFLLTLAFGFGIGWVASQMAVFGKIRTTALAAAVGLLAGLVGMYVYWSASLLALSGGESGLVLDPFGLMAYGMALYQEGSWGLSEDAPVKGVFLVLIWVVEAGLVLGLAVFTARLGVADKVFCESCGRWAEVDENLPKLLPPPGDETALDRVASGNLAGLADMIRVGGTEGVYVQLSLAQCPSCDRCNYVTAEVVVHGTDKEGKATVQKQAILKHLAVDPAAVGLVRQAGRDATAEELQQWEET
jgi:hypothetical protein